MSVVTQTSPQGGRLPKAVLLGLALSSRLFAYYLVHLGIGESGLPPSFPQIFLVTVLTTTGAHIAVRRFAPYADPVFFPTALALNGLGLAMIYRVDIAEETDHASNQLLLSFVAITPMVGTVIVLRSHRILRRFTWTSLTAGIALLLLPMVPGLGRTINGARIQINIGMSFQPAELAKIYFVVFFAGYLVTERDNFSLAGPKFLGIRWPKARHFIPILAAWAARMAVLVMEKGFGTAILFFGLFVGILYVATERVSWAATGGLLAALGIAVIVSQVSHIQARFIVWLYALDPDVYDSAHGSLQLVQGFFGMASGESFGTGLGRGYPNKVYVASSDFIIASFAEEIGLIGLLALLYIYLIIVVRGLRTAVVLRDSFGELLVTGIAFTAAIQCLVVAGGVTRLIPLTGLAMSFSTHGGLALMANWIIIGLPLCISDSARRPTTADPLPSDDFLKTIPKLEKDSSLDKNNAPETRMVKL